VVGQPPRDFEAMGKIAGLQNLETLEETKRPFPHFEPVTL
jgi:hypothetical protein